jgi:E2/UBC family protein E
MMAMANRIDLEYEHLKNVYPSAILSAARDWVEIPDFALPNLYATAITRVRMPLTAAYPDAAPDNFYVPPGFRLKDGQVPNNYADVPKFGETWGQYSWHPQRWRGKAEIEQGDNMSTFFNSVRKRLEEGK